MIQTDGVQTIANACPRPRRPVTGGWRAPTGIEPDVNVLLRVAARWAEDSDWNVPIIGIDLLRELAVALAAGDDVEVLARHSKHLQSDCVIVRCETRIPYFWSEGA